MPQAGVAGLAGGAVILAAGAATRFGGDKRHYPLAGDRTMLEVALVAYQAVFDPIFVVLKPSDRPWARHLAGIQPVYAMDAALGMGHSLAAGVAAARHLDYLFVALADMPYVREATLQQLRRELCATDHIVRPCLQGTPGHPVGFGSDYFNALQGLVGDVGAKEVIGRHSAQVRYISVADPGIVQDIDVPPTTATSRI